jgi:nocardicin N-oxygenase
VAAEANNLFGYLAALIADKRAHPAEDLITRLVVASEDGTRLSEQEALVNTFLLIAGGYETTANLLANSVLTLHRHPQQREALRANPDLIPGAVEELLRYVRISHCATERVTVRELELSGVSIPVGSVVIPLQYSANRDPDCTTDPDRFDVTRPPTQHLAFGYGPHRCLGAPLARLELHAALNLLLQRLPNLRPTVPTGDLPWKTGLLTRGPLTLPVTW